MLRLARTVLLSLLVVGGWLIGTGDPALADEEVYCPPLRGACIVRATSTGSPGTPGGSGGGGASSTCRRLTGEAVACYDEVMGWFDPLSDCYHNGYDADGQPLDAGYYHVWCPGANVVGVQGDFEYVGILYREIPPPGDHDRAPTPALLAAEAINRLGIRGPRIGMAPDPDGSGLVGLPVWMWTEVTPQTWGPISATASVPGLSVTATANARRVVWSMGDGGTVTCTGPGTPYRASFGNSSSPDCGYRYVAASAGRPGGRFAVTATTTWQVTWTGGGESGELTVTRASTTAVDIGELHVVIS